MRRLALVLIFILAAALAHAGQEEDHDLGYEAYQRGDYEEAAYHWRRIAEAGARNAAYNLAQLYAQGLGVQQSFEEAFRWYLHAANQGDINAQVRVGGMYAYGLGTGHDHFEAYKWLLLAKRLDVRDTLNVEAMIKDLYEVTASQHHHKISDFDRKRAEEWVANFVPIGTHLGGRSNENNAANNY